MVLIETLWNVKSGVDKNVVIETICINRNIVECKVYHTHKDEKGNLVLIETLWNVKIEFVSENFDDFCINRNIVECKGRHYHILGRIILCINRNIVECKVI